MTWETSFPRCTRVASSWSSNRLTSLQMSTINHSKRLSSRSSINITQEYLTKTCSLLSKKLMKSKILQPDRWHRWCRIMQRLKSYSNLVRIRNCLQTISGRILSRWRKLWRTRTSGCVPASASWSLDLLPASEYLYGSLLRFLADKTNQCRFYFPLSCMLM